MRKVFIDLGAYDGDTIEQFYNWGHLLGDPYEFEVYAFEPNPEHQEKLKKLEDTKPKLKVSNKAAWTYDGFIDFTVDDVGSTIMQSKKNWGNGMIIPVPCFDFSTWLKQFKNDYVIVKMDIEGAEFSVLEKMIIEGSIWAVDRLWAEMHPNKVTDYTTTYKNNLVAQLKVMTDFWEWH